MLDTSKSVFQEVGAPNGGCDLIMDRRCGIEIRSDVFHDGQLAVGLGEVEQDDALSDDLYLPLDDGGRAFAHVTLNGYRWFLANRQD